MGTRADFYVGRGEKAEWVGSIAWDGYPEGIDKRVLHASTEKGYRGAVATMLLDGASGTTPDMGWPWPWDDSRTTDYAYLFHEGQTLVSRYGREACSLAEHDDPDAHDRPKTEVFPDMSAIAKPTLGPRSGLFVFAS